MQQVAQPNNTYTTSDAPQPVNQELLDLEETMRETAVTRSNLTEWMERVHEGQWRVTPSGLNVRVKVVGLMDLINKGGAIPQPLVPLVTKVINTGTKLEEGKADEFEKPINLIVQAAVVEPKITTSLVQNAPDELPISMIPMNDRMAIFKYANGDAEALASFPVEQGTSSDA